MGLGGSQPTCQLPPMPRAHRVPHGQAGDCNLVFECLGPTKTIKHQPAAAGVQNRLQKEIAKRIVQKHAALAPPERHTLSQHWHQNARSPKTPTLNPSCALVKAAVQTSPQTRSREPSKRRGSKNNRFRGVHGWHKKPSSKTTQIRQ
jgi:hypothetical protein